MPDDRVSDHRDNPVVLSRIYTRTGDDGSTALTDGSRARKTDPRLAAYADTDEANCAIGVAVTMGQLPAAMVTLLGQVQNELFDIGADLANPVSDEPREWPPIRVDDSYIEGLERACDEYNASLPALRSFVLPGGAPGAALLHAARTVTRRAERSAWAAREEHGDTVSPMPAKYLNRLSDLLFILARAANASAGLDDVLWRPGGDRLPWGIHANPPDPLCRHGVAVGTSGSPAGSQETAGARRGIAGYPARLRREGLSAALRALRGSPERARRRSLRSRSLRSRRPRGASACPGGIRTEKAAESASGTETAACLGAGG